MTLPDATLDEKEKLVRWIRDACRAEGIDAESYLTRLNLSAPSETRQSVLQDVAAAYLVHDTAAGFKNWLERQLKNAPASAASAIERKPVAWRYRYHYGVAGENKGMWKYADTEDECNQSPYYEREALYAE